MDRLIAECPSVQVRQRVGNRVVIGAEFWTRSSNGNRHRTVVCRCDCGNVHVVLSQTLRQGLCGACAKCAHHGRWQGLSKTENGQDHSLYSVWSLIKQRCNNPRCKQYPNYGGRGIDIIDEWKTSYIAFYEWALSHGWKQGLHIDRSDNDGWYSPENCRFVTRNQNNRNRRSTSRISAFGETKSLVEWSEDERCVVEYACLRDRIVNRKMDPEIAMSTVNMKTTKGGVA